MFGDWIKLAQTAIEHLAEIRRLLEQLVEQGGPR